MTLKLAIIDYGLGNLHSVHKAFQKVAADVEEDWQVTLVNDAESILAADKVVFPGVGAIRDCMGGLSSLGLMPVMQQILQTKPLLAICVGMQALMTHSQENNGVDCLDWVAGEVKRFNPSAKTLESVDDHIKVPHMGWNQVKQLDHVLWQNIPDQSRFYFVHSYYVPDEGVPTVGRCHYGVDFAAAIGKDNWFAVQFHPEKSHVVGLQLLKNFLNWSP